jgi:hypothetical protein
MPGFTIAEGGWLGWGLDVVGLPVPEGGGVPLPQCQVVEVEAVGGGLSAVGGVLPPEAGAFVSQLQHTREDQGGTGFGDLVGDEHGDGARRPVRHERFAQGAQANSRRAATPGERALSGVVGIGYGRWCG